MSDWKPVFREGYDADPRRCGHFGAWGVRDHEDETRVQRGCLQCGLVWYEPMPLGPAF